MAIISSAYAAETEQETHESVGAPGGEAHHEGVFPPFQTENFAPQLRRKRILTGIRLTEDLLAKKGVAFLPGSDFYFPATNLGVRVASVDFDGAAVRERWPGIDGMDETLTRELFPNLVEGCDRLEEYLDEL